VETSLSFFLSHNFELVLELGQDPMEARKQVRNDLTSGFTVKHIGGVYPDDEHATDDIDNDRAFSARNEYRRFRGSLATLGYQ